MLALSTGGVVVTGSCGGGVGVCEAVDGTVACVCVFEAVNRTVAWVGVGKTRDVTVVCVDVDCGLKCGWWCVSAGVGRGVEAAARDMCGNSGAWCGCEKVTYVLGMTEMRVLCLVLIKVFLYFFS